MYKKFYIDILIPAILIHMASVLPKTDSPASSSSVPSAVARSGDPSDLDVLEVVFVFLDLDSFFHVSLFASIEVLTTSDLDDLHCIESNDFN